MNIGFCIVTVDDSRAELRGAARRALTEAGLNEITGVNFVDGRKPGTIELEILQRELPITGERFHRGELGIWFSTLNALDAFLGSNLDYVIVLEDDAVVHESFAGMLKWVMPEIPEDMDFFSWTVPVDQKVDYYYNRTFNDTGGWWLNSRVQLPYRKSPHYIEGNELVCRAYQGYQAVATMYSRKGAERLFELIEKQGVRCPFDLFLFENHHGKEDFNGYTLYPDVNPAITFEELGTIARNSGMFN